MLIIKQRYIWTSCFEFYIACNGHCKEKFEDTKGIIRSRKSKILMQKNVVKNVYDILNAYYCKLTGCII